MSKTNVSHAPLPASLAPTKVPGNFNHETATIDGWIATHARSLTPMEREAVARLVFTPFDVASIEAACARASAIVGALRRGPSAEIAEYMFEDVIKEADKRAAGVRS